MGGNSVNGKPHLADNSATLPPLRATGISVAEISDSQFVVPPWGEDLCDPRLFLALVSAEWIPHVVGVWRGSQMAGMVFAKERKIRGFASRLLYCDGILLPVVVAERDHSDVLHAALHYFFTERKMRGIRMLITPEHCDAARFGNASAKLGLDLSFSPREYHSRLILADSYEGFLNSLGKSTRHNFRKYRRRFESEGNHYEDKVTFEAFSEAAFRFKGQSKVVARTDAVRRALKVLELVRRPFFTGLRRDNGEWLGILGGFYDGPAVTLFMQLNSDRTHLKDSLSQVLRGYAIETMIGQGVKEVRFWAGTSFPLARYAENIPSMTASLDSRALAWRAFRYISAQAASYFPRLFPADLHAIGSVPTQAHDY